MRMVLDPDHEVDLLTQVLAFLDHGSLKSFSSISRNMTTSFVRQYLYQRSCVVLPANAAFVNPHWFTLLKEPKLTQIVVPCIDDCRIAINPVDVLQEARISNSQLGWEKITALRFIYEEYETSSSPLEESATTRGMDVSVLGTWIKCIPNLQKIDVTDISMDNIHWFTKSYHVAMSLKTLHLNAANLGSDLSSLATLTQLEHLVLYDYMTADPNNVELINNHANTSPKGLDFLAPLTQLQSLELWYCTVSELSVLRRLKQLKKLRLNVVKARELAPIWDLNALQQLYLEFVGEYVEVEIDSSGCEVLPELEKVVIRSVNIDNLTFLSRVAPNVKELTVVNTEMSDVQSLASLQHLQWLKMEIKKDMDLFLLGRLRHLNYLELTSTWPIHLKFSEHVNISCTLPKLEELRCPKIMEVEMLDAHLPHLARLHLTALASDDLAQLAALTTLSSLRTLLLKFERRGGRIRLLDLSFLQKLMQLERLSLLDAQAKDWTPLTSLMRLRQLNISLSSKTENSHEATRDFSPLQQLKRLRRLSMVNRAEFGDADVIWLEDLNHLEFIDLRGTSVSNSKAVSTSVITHRCRQAQVNPLCVAMVDTWKRLPPTSDKQINDGE